MNDDESKPIKVHLFPGSQVLAEELKRQAGDRKERPCRLCGTMWQPGVWCFYDLCDQCFARFDDQKMAGRATRMAAFVSGSAPTAYFENCDEWIAIEKGRRS